MMKERVTTGGKLIIEGEMTTIYIEQAIEVEEGMILKEIGDMMIVIEKEEIMIQEIMIKKERKVILRSMIGMGGKIMKGTTMIKKDIDIVIRETMKFNKLLCILIIQVD